MLELGSVSQGGHLLAHNWSCEQGKNQNLKHVLFPIRGKGHFVASGETKSAAAAGKSIPRCRTLPRTFNRKQIEDCESKTTLGKNIRSVYYQLSLIP